MFIQLESELLLRLSIKNLLGPGTADSCRGYGGGLGTSALRLSYRDNHVAPAARDTNSGLRCVPGDLNSKILITVQPLFGRALETYHSSTDRELISQELNCQREDLSKVLDPSSQSDSCY